MIKKSKILSFLIATFILSSLAVMFGFADSAGTSASSFDTCPISVRGSGEEVVTSSGSTILDTEKYDAVVVGAGLGGLSSSVFLAMQNKKILVLEKTDYLGGLAASVEQDDGVIYDRGAAYWTSAYPEELEILKAIKLGKYEDKYQIEEPIDSYLWNGQLYKGVWDEKTLNELPSSFALFKYVLEKANDERYIPDQPIEEFESKGGHLDLDLISATDWIRSMPTRFLDRYEKDRQEILNTPVPEGDKKAAEKKQHDLVWLDGIYNRFAQEQKPAGGDPSRINPSDQMKDVVDFLDLYCRSALGTTGDKVSAVAFANFYVSEIDTRYTTERGTGQAATNMEKLLRKKYKKLVKIVTSAPVTSLENEQDHVNVTYNYQGHAHRVQSNYVVFAAQVKLAPKLIVGLVEKSPVQATLMSNLGYSNYSVDNVKVEGHPYRASYDTWVRFGDYTDLDFTDVIYAPWVSKEIKKLGESFRNFSKNPKNPEGIYTIYHPISPSWEKKIGKGYDEEQARIMSRYAVERFFDKFSPVVKGPFVCHSVVTNRWPISVHIAAPSHFTQKARILRKPFGNIFFADNNLGTPAFEEALFRGHCAANNVLTRMNPNFQNEKWSRCPIDR